MSLTDTAVRNTKPRQKPFKLSDEKGLYLLVAPNGSKLWRLKYRFANKEKKLALGVYPEVTLALARERQLEARRLVATGIDPGTQKKQANRSAKVAAANTFEAVAREWYLKFSPPWAESHSVRVLARLENDLFPWLGKRPIAEIEADELLETVQRVANRGALDTAHRCLGSSSQIFRYAIATTRAKRNPAADLRGALPPAQGEHFASIIEPEAIGELLRAMYGYQGNLTTRLALRLASMTFVRPGTLRAAQWRHFRLDDAEWQIPGALMKMKEDLIVPLSRQAMEVVTELQPRTGDGRFLFPCESYPDRPMSENTINGALRRLGFSGEEMTGHGFRAMARTVLDEVLDFRPDWIDHQLAHKVKDPNGRAYNRTAFLLGRKKMMQTWSDYLDGLRMDSAIEPIRKAA